MKRLAIYVYHGRTGRMPEYVVYCLNGLKLVVDSILVVAHGGMTAEDHETLKKIEGVEVLTHDGEENDSDYIVYKAGIEHYGYDEISELDELLLTDDSYYSPLYPFTEMWNAMNRVECDFWGITKRASLEADPVTWKKFAHKVEGFIQDYWLVLRKTVLSANDFKTYWWEMGSHANRAMNLEEENGGFSGFLQSRGYLSAEYINHEKYAGEIYDPLLINDILVMKEQCPIVKRECFFKQKNISIHFRSDGGMRPLLDYLDKNHLYDSNLIWEDLLASCDMPDLDENLSLIQILPSDSTAKISTIPAKQVAIVVYIFHAKLVDYFLGYLKNVPVDQDKIIVTANSDVERLCRNIFCDIENISFRTQPNRGRDIAALWVTCRDIFDRYEYMCFVHSKMSPHNNAGIIGTEFREHCVKSLLFSRQYINNILILFEENPCLGILMPLVPPGFSYQFTLFEFWMGNAENTRNLLNRLGIHCKEFGPRNTFPIGSMYWARTKSLVTLAHAGLTYDDFPEEAQMRVDGMLPHAIERSICFIAKYNNYYSMYVAPDKYAGILLTNLSALVRRERAIKDSLRSIVKALGTRSIFRYLRNQYMRTTLFSHIFVGQRRAHYQEKRGRLKGAMETLRTLDKNNSI